MMEREVLLVPTKAMLWGGYKPQASVYHRPGCPRVKEGAYRMPERTARSLGHESALCQCNRK